VRDILVHECCRRSKWYFVPSLVTTAVLDAFVLISGYFLFVLMQESGCATVLDNVLIPFLGTVPFVFLSKRPQPPINSMLRLPISVARCGSQRVSRASWIAVGLIGPYGYIAHNTWGMGDRITEVLAAEKEDKAMVFKNPLF